MTGVRMGEDSSRAGRSSNRAEWRKGYTQLDYEGWEKFKVLGPLLGELQDEGKIGELVVDVGSAYLPISQHIPGKHTLITIDYAGRATTASMPILHADTVHIPYDAQNVARQGSFDNKKALVKVAKLLGTDPRNTRNAECADTMLFSEILNYVDFRSTLLGFSRYLKPGGRFIIFNMPGRGYGERFAEKGVKNNTELRDFLTENGFAIEKAVFPRHVRPDDWDDSGMVFLVARKKVEGE